MRTTIRAAYAMLAGAVVVAATAEAGNPMPRYDVAVYCGKVSEAVGESPPDLRLLRPEGKRGLRRPESSLGHGAGEGPGALRRHWSGRRQLPDPGLLRPEGARRSGGPARLQVLGRGTDRAWPVAGFGRPFSLRPPVSSGEGKQAKEQGDNGPCGRHLAGIVDQRRNEGVGHHGIRPIGLRHPVDSACPEHEPPDRA